MLAKSIFKVKIASRCRSCAEECFDKRGTRFGISGGRFKCPTCRYEVVLDRHGTFGLPRNLLVENIIDMMGNEKKNREAEKQKKLLRENFVLSKDLIGHFYLKIPNFRITGRREKESRTRELEKRSRKGIKVLPRPRWHAECVLYDLPKAYLCPMQSIWRLPELLCNANRAGLRTTAARNHRLRETHRKIQNFNKLAPKT